MLNLIGEIPTAARQLDQGTLHDYGKEPRPGRKLGHITVVTERPEQCDAFLNVIEQTVTQSTMVSGKGP
jgi:5-(carboxyamino)imidazole ribonucleotide synthase